MLFIFQKKVLKISIYFKIAKMTKNSKFFLIIVDKKASIQSF